MSRRRQPLANRPGPQLVKDGSHRLDARRLRIPRVVDDAGQLLDQGLGIGVGQFEVHQRYGWLRNGQRTNAPEQTAFRDKLRALP